MGTSQLLIARDPKFVNIVNVIPLEGGNVIINKHRDSKTALTIYTHDRKFELKFSSEHEADEWRTAMVHVLSKQIKVDKYKKRKKVQRDILSKINKVQAFLNLWEDIKQNLQKVLTLMTEQR